MHPGSPWTKSLLRFRTCCIAASRCFKITLSFRGGMNWTATRYQSGAMSIWTMIWLRAALHRCQITLGLQHPDTTSCVLYCGFVAIHSKKYQGKRLIRQTPAETAKANVVEHDRGCSVASPGSPDTRESRNSTGKHYLFLSQTAYKEYAAIARAFTTQKSLDSLQDCGISALQMKRVEEAQRIFRQLPAETEMLDGEPRERALLLCLLSITCLKKTGVI